MKKLFLCLICGIVASLSLHAASPKWALKDVKANSEFHDGRAVFLEYERGEGSRYGAIGTDGVVKIRPQFKHMTDFCNGLSVVETLDGKYGIINIHGTFVLNPIYSEISEVYKKPGVYTVETMDSKKGLFADNRLAVAPEYDYIYAGNYPFVSLDKEYLNFATGEKFWRVDINGGIAVAICFNEEFKYFNPDGTPFNSNRITESSSKGLVLHQGKISGKYGFAMEKTREIVVAPKYDGIVFDKWIDDRIIVKASYSSYYLINEDGEEVLKAENMRMEGAFIWTENKIDGKYLEGLYDLNGNEIIKPQEASILPIDIDKGWFYCSNFIINAYTKQVFNIKKDSGWGYDDGMISATSTKDKRLYINTETGKTMTYDVGLFFGEGITCVQEKSSDKYFNIIDNNGKVILVGSEECNPIGQKCSEGVLAVYNSQNNSYCYIHNPLGNTKYKYNQKSASKDVLKEWLNNGHEEFNKGNYSKAKNYYYRIMIADPFDANAIYHYGICLNNMGYYDEAISAYETALDIDPKNEFAKKELQRSRENKQIVANSQQVVAEENQSSTFWDALSCFGQILMQATGGGNANYQPINSFSNDYIGNSNSSSGSGINWQAQYSRWENEARSLYDRLTSSGLRVKDNQGNMSGTNAGNVAPRYYIGLKQNLRRAQSEMRKIRQKARQDGITIPESKYESAAVSY